jgi:hypothetical protein
MAADVTDHPLADTRGTASPHAGQSRYEERPGIPVWAAALITVVWGGVLGIIAWLAPPDTIGVVLMICLFVFPVAYSVWTHARRRVRIDDELFRLGRREPVPLEAIQGFGTLTGKPLRELRSELFWPAPSGGVSIGAALAAAAGAWGAASIASAQSGARSRYGLACPFWFRSAVVVYAPDTGVKRSTWAPRRMPDVWLIGTPRPDELVGKLRQACEARRATLARE